MWTGFIELRTVTMADFVWIR